MQRKLLIIIALVAITFSLTAQSIRVFSPCREQSRVFTFSNYAAKGEPTKHFTIGSHCPNLEMPNYRLAPDNYDFKDLPVRDGEGWTYFIENGERMLKRGVIKDKWLFAELSEGERLTIIIAPKLECNCPKTASK